MDRNILKYILLLSVLFLLITPTFAKSRTEARAKACYTNQQILNDVLTEYFYKTNKRISSVIPDLNIKAVEEFLVKEKYLDKFEIILVMNVKLIVKENPEDYLVYCEYHGTIDGKIPPSEAYKKSTVTPVPAVSYEAAAIFAVVIIFLIFFVIKDFHNMAKEDVSSSNKS